MKLSPVYFIGYAPIRTTRQKVTNPVPLSVLRLSGGDLAIKL